MSNVDAREARVCKGKVTAVAVRKLLLLSRKKMLVAWAVCGAMGVEKGDGVVGEVVVRLWGRGGWLGR